MNTNWIFETPSFETSEATSDGEWHGLAPRDVRLNQWLTLPCSGKTPSVSSKLKQKTSWRVFQVIRNTAVDLNTSAGKDEKLGEYVTYASPCVCFYLSKLFDAYLMHNKIPTHNKSDKK